MSDVAPVELGYVEQGSGPADLLLHGFPLDELLDGTQPE